MSWRGGKSSNWLWVVGGLFLLAVVAVLVIALVPAGRVSAVAGGTREVRVTSVGRLVAKRPAGAGQALAAAVRDDPDPVVRKTAVIGLGRLRDAEARPAIESAMGDDDASVRAASATAMSAYRDAEAAQALGKLLAEDANPGVRVAAAGALGVNPTDQAIVLLMANAETNSSPAARHRAAKELLQRVGERFYRAVDSTNRAEWPALIEHLKRLETVRRAYEACGVALVRHPEHYGPHGGDGAHGDHADGADSDE